MTPRPPAATMLLPLALLVAASPTANAWYAEPYYHYAPLVPSPLQAMLASARSPWESPFAGWPTVSRVRRAPSPLLEMVHELGELLGDAARTHAQIKVQHDDDGGLRLALHDLPVDEDVKVEVDGRALVVSATAGEARYRRTIELPRRVVDASHISATIEHGLVHVHVPASALAAPPKSTSIPVRRLDSKEPAAALTDAADGGEAKEQASATIVGGDNGASAPRVEQ